MTKKELETKLIELEAQLNLIKEIVVPVSRSTWPYRTHIMGIGCQHEYPTMWHGTIPPACTKCGYWQNSSVTFTVTS